MLKSRLFWLSIIVIALVLTLKFTPVGSYLTLSQIQRNMVCFKQYVEQNYIISALTYTSILVVMAAVSVPVIVFYVLLGGFLFGTIAGALYSVIGATLGATISFLIFRYALHDTLKKKYAHGLASFHEKMKDHGTSYILVLHYLSVVPFFVINSFAALSPITLKQFIGITIMGCLPLFFVYAFAGRELGTIHSTKDIFSPEVIAACALLIGLALLPIVIKKLRNKRTKHTS